MAFVNVRHDNEQTHTLQRVREVCDFPLENVKEALVPHVPSSHVESMNAMTYNPQSCPLQITNTGKPHKQHKHSTNQPGLILPIIMLLIYRVRDSLDIECPIEGFSHMSSDASN